MEFSLDSISILFDRRLENPPFGQWKSLEDLVNVRVFEGKQFQQFRDLVLGLEELKQNSTLIILIKPFGKEPVLHLRPGGSDNIRLQLLRLRQLSICCRCCRLNIYMCVCVYVCVCVWV